MEFKEGQFIFFKEDDDRMIYIDTVCKCELCKERGFNEPFAIKIRLGESPCEDYITYIEAQYLVEDIKRVTNNRYDQEVQKFLNNVLQVAITEAQQYINIGMKEE